MFPLGSSSCCRLLLLLLLLLIFLLLLLLLLSPVVLLSFPRASTTFGLILLLCRLFRSLLLVLSAPFSTWLRSPSSCRSSGSPVRRVLELLPLLPLAVFLGEGSRALAAHVVPSCQRLGLGPLGLTILGGLSQRLRLSALHLGVPPSLLLPFPFRARGG